MNKYSKIVFISLSVLIGMIVLIQVILYSGVTTGIFHKILEKELAENLPTGFKAEKIRVIFPVMMIVENITITDKNKIIKLNKIKITFDMLSGFHPEFYNNPGQFIKKVYSSQAEINNVEPDYDVFTWLAPVNLQTGAETEPFLPDLVELVQFNNIKLNFTTGFSFIIDRINLINGDTNSMNVIINISDSDKIAESLKIYATINETIKNKMSFIVNGKKLNLNNVLRITNKNKIQNLNSLLDIDMTLKTSSDSIYSIGILEDLYMSVNAKMKFDKINYNNTVNGSLFVDINDEWITVKNTKNKCSFLNHNLHIDTFIMNVITGDIDANINTNIDVLDYSVSDISTKLSFITNSCINGKLYNPGLNSNVNIKLNNKDFLKFNILFNDGILDINPDTNSTIKHIKKFSVDVNDSVSKNINTTLKYTDVFFNRLISKVFDIQINTKNLIKKIADITGISLNKKIGDEYSFNISNSFSNAKIKCNGHFNRIQFKRKYLKDIYFELLYNDTVFKWKLNSSDNKLIVSNIDDNILLTLKDFNLSRYLYSFTKSNLFKNGWSKTNVVSMVQNGKVFYKGDIQLQDIINKKTNINSVFLSLNADTDQQYYSLTCKTKKNVPVLYFNNDTILAENLYIYHNDISSYINSKSNYNIDNKMFTGYVNFNKCRYRKNRPININLSINSNYNVMSIDKIKVNDYYIGYANYFWDTEYVTLIMMNNNFPVSIPVNFADKKYKIDDDTFTFMFNLYGQLNKLNYYLSVNSNKFNISKNVIRELSVELSGQNKIINNINFLIDNADFRLESLGKGILDKKIKLNLKNRLISYKNNFYTNLKSDIVYDNPDDIKISLDNINVAYDKRQTALPDVNIKIKHDNYSLQLRENKTNIGNVNIINDKISGSVNISLLLDRILKTYFNDPIKIKENNTVLSLKGKYTNPQIYLMSDMENININKQLIKFNNAKFKGLFTKKGFYIYYLNFDNLKISTPRTITYDLNYGTLTSRGNLKLFQIYNIYMDNQITFNKNKIHSYFKLFTVNGYEYHDLHFNGNKNNGTYKFVNDRHEKIKFSLVSSSEKLSLKCSITSFPINVFLPEIYDIYYKIKGTGNINLNYYDDFDAYSKFSLNFSSENFEIKNLLNKSTFKLYGKIDKNELVVSDIKLKNKSVNCYNTKTLKIGRDSLSGNLFIISDTISSNINLEYKNNRYNILMKDTKILNRYKYDRAQFTIIPTQKGYKIETPISDIGFKISGSINKRAKLSEYRMVLNTNFNKFNGALLKYFIKHPEISFKNTTITGNLLTEGTYSDYTMDGEITFDDIHAFDETFKIDLQNIKLFNKNLNINKIICTSSKMDEVTGTLKYNVNQKYPLSVKLSSSKFSLVNFLKKEYDFVNDNNIDFTSDFNIRYYHNFETNNKLMVGQFSAKNIVFQKSHFDTLYTKINLENDILILDDINFNNYTSGSVKYNLNDYTMNGNISINNFNFSKMSQSDIIPDIIQNDDLVMSGKVIFDKYTDKKFKINTTLDIKHVIIFDNLYENIKVNLNIDEEGIFNSNLLARSYKGMCNIKNIKLIVKDKLKNLSLNDIVFTNFPIFKFNLNGECNYTLDLKSNNNSLELSKTRLTIPKLVINDYVVEDVDELLFYDKNNILRSGTDNKIIKGKCKIDFNNMLVSDINCKINIPQLGFININGQWSEKDDYKISLISSFINVEKLQAIYKISGIDKGFITLSGDLNSIDNVIMFQNGKLTINRFEFNDLNIDKIISNFNIEKGYIDIEKFYAEEPGKLLISGKYPLNNQNEYDLNIKFNDNILSYLSIFKDTLNNSEDNGEILISVEGTKNKPVVNGRIYIDKGELELNKYSNELKDIFAEIIVDDNDIKIKKIKCTTIFNQLLFKDKKGKMLIQGKIKTNYLDPNDINVYLYTDDEVGIFLDIPEFVKGYLTSKIHVTGTPDSIYITGRSTLYNAEFTYPPGGQYNKGVKKSKVPTLNWNHTITTGKNVIFYNDAVNIPILGNLTLREVKNNLNLKGKITANSGEFQYLDKTFEVEEASLVFTGDVNEGLPELEIVGITRIEDVEIKIIVGGRLDKLNIIDLSSDPELSQNYEENKKKIVSLLTFGVDTTKWNMETINQKLRNGLSSFVGYQLQTNVFSPLTKIAKRYLKIDSFKIQPGIIKKLTGDSESFFNVPADAYDFLDQTKISFGKYVTQDLYLRAEIDFLQGENQLGLETHQTIGLDYNLLKGLSAYIEYGSVLNRDNASEFEAGFQIKRNW